MRTLLRTAGAAVLALALFGSPAAALKLGDSCGNDDALACDDGLRCYNNVCDVTRPAPAGLANKCSESDCCPSKTEDGSDSRLVCNKKYNRCLYSIPLMTELLCGGGETTPNANVTLPDLPDDVRIPGVGGYEGGSVVIGGVTIVDGGDNNNTNGTNPDNGGSDNGGDNGSNNGATGDGDVIIDNPTPEDPIVIDGSSGTIVINPDGSVDEKGAAPTAATAAMGIMAGVAATAAMLL